MPIDDYNYPVERCDIPEVRRAVLEEYRKYRHRCLEYLRGSSPTSVMNQVYDLAWKTAVFRTMNEARRLEPRRTVSGALWELTTDGYVGLMSIGIRKLVDRDSRTDSIWRLLTVAEKCPELLTREMFVCYDGLPFDYEAKRREIDSNTDWSKEPTVRWLPTRGPEAWPSAELSHKAFDKLTSHKGERKRLDRIDAVVLDQLKKALSHPAIEKVCTLAVKQIVHAERHASPDDRPVGPSFNDFDAALGQIVKIANHLSTAFFNDAAFGSIVPTPQFDVLKGLDAPWVTKKNLGRLDDFWWELAESMAKWTDEEPDYSFTSELGAPSPQ